MIFRKFVYCTIVTTCSILIIIGLPLIADDTYQAPEILDQPESSDTHELNSYETEGREIASEESQINEEQNIKNITDDVPGSEMPPVNNNDINPESPFWNADINED